MSLLEDSSLGALVISENLQKSKITVSFSADIDNFGNSRECQSNNRGQGITGEDCFVLIALGSCIMIANKFYSNVQAVQET